jgi:hemoglobin
MMDADTETPALDVEALEPTISACVRNFYVKGNADPLLGPIFKDWIHDWDEHYSHMDAFWSRILLNTTRYRRNPFIPHHPLKLRDEHFDRWRDLFQAAARETLPQPIQDRAVAAAGQMAHCWRYQMMPAEDQTSESSSCG